MLLYFYSFASGAIFISLWVIALSAAWTKESRSSNIMIFSTLDSLDWSLGVFLLIFGTYPIAVSYYSVKCFLSRNWAFYCFEKGFFKGNCVICILFDRFAMLSGKSGSLIGGLTARAELWTIYTASFTASEALPEAD